VFVFVFYRTKHWIHFARLGADGDIWSEDRGVSRGMKKNCTVRGCMIDTGGGW
jgi:hypothetical protein